MSDRLDEYIDPLALAAKGRSLAGRIPLAKMERLAQSLLNTDGEAEVSLRFERDPVGLPQVVGSVKTVLTLQCQRCMQAMQLPVVLDVCLGIVRNRLQAERLPESHDPLMVSEEEITAKDIVEDELILALPIVAMHELKDCPAAEHISAEDETGQEQPVPERKNPFAVLAELKNRSND